MGKKIDYKIGDIINGFRLNKFIEKINGNRSGEFLCHCGNLFNAKIYSIKNGRTPSCGCLYIKNLHERSLIHGHALVNNVSDEYGIWLGMKNRCNNPKTKSYPKYGGRGVRVDESWNNSFPNFLKDMGYRPSKKHSLDRYPNNNGNYEKSNCRWATSKEQGNNTRRCKLITYKYKTQTLMQWVEELGLSYGNTHKRIFKSGWSIEDAFTLGKQHGSRYVSKRKVA